jgi:hypothetical protein
VDTQGVPIRRLVPVLFGLTALALMSGCAGTGYHYVKRSEDHTYFKVPDSWKLFDEDQMLAADKSLSEEERTVFRDNAWETGFDGSPQPSVQHLDIADNRHPVGRAMVLSLSGDAADELSLKTLRNLFFDIDGIETGDSANVLEYRRVNFDGGFRGSRFVAEVSRGKKTFTVNQIAVVDQATNKIHALVVTCTRACYDANEEKIEAIVDSYTVDGD